MKLVCISDTHGLHDQARLPQGDILIHAGDVTNHGELHETQRFLEWFSSVGSFRHRVMIAGNHDYLFEHAPEVISDLMPPNVTYLQASGATVAGLRFWGSPITPYYFNWAFNYREHEIQPHWQLIPPALDVLITHGPPHLILDEVGHDREPVGCPYLKKRLRQVRPRLHVFGHIHEGHGVQAANGTQHVNAALCNADYRMAQPPIVIDW